jgi:hypothetical protein
MTKNHKTTTLLVAMTAIAATLLAAGTVAALGSNHSAFAHKEYKKNYDKYNKEESGRDGNNIAISKQFMKCIVIGGGDGMKGSEHGRADLVTPPPADDGRTGISGNSCNNQAPTNTNNDGDSSTMHGSPSIGGPGDGRGM